jgi:hypothetical protein
MVEIACDFPNAADSFAVLVLEFLGQNPQKLQLSSIHIPEQYCEGEDAEFMLEFYQDFLKKLVDKLASSDYSVKPSKKYINLIGHKDFLIRRGSFQFCKQNKKGYK